MRDSGRAAAGEAQEWQVSAPAGPATRRSVYLHPGQTFASAKPAEAVTILGSCVCVCLWDPSRRAGGANHFLLPRWMASLAEGSARYGNVALEKLLGELARLGSRPTDLQAKVFGGANVLEAFRGRRNHLGVQNVEEARRGLGAAGIRIVAEDVGGDHGRKVLFHTDTGIALVRLI
jgi:chemotaxis protein CheD